MTSIRFMIVLNTVQFNLGFTIDALENDSVEGLKEYTADNLINFLTRQTDKDLMADLVKGLGSTVKTKTDSDSSQGNQLG